ncbi:MAG: FHA domain-containing protein [Chloroflexota bacterium]
MTFGTQPHPSQKRVTEFIDSNYRADTDVRTYTAITRDVPLPTQQRTLRLHIPQLIEPLLLLNPITITIGRDSGADRLDLSRQYAKLLGVSRDHAKLSYHDGCYFITDLESTNGTFLNNMRLEPYVAHRLTQNDQLRFGHFVAIVNYS